MKEIKFTSDGKKVSVIGSLNSKEFIVQEIFVTKDGAEIPSGENFVVKSLHDAPVKSWKENQLAKIEEIYKSKAAEYERKTTDLKKSSERLIGEIREKNSYLRKYVDKSGQESFDLLNAFLCDEKIYFVTEDYKSGPVITDKQDIICNYDRDKLKLLSLYGRDDGTLQWNIHYYSDGSGGSTSIFMFLRLSDARIKLQQILDKKKYWKPSYEDLCKEHDLKIDYEKIKLFKENRDRELRSAIESKKAEITKLKEERKSLEL